MKHLFTILIIALCTTSLFAQGLEGRLLIGGDFFLWVNNDIENQSFNGEPRKFEDSRFRFEINPHVGRFLNDHTVLGLGVGYGYYYSKSKSTSDNAMDDNESSSSTHQASLNTYLTKFYKLGGDFYFTSNVNLSLAVGRRNSEQYISNRFSIGASLAPGVSCFVNDKWRIAAGIGSLYYSWTRESLVEGPFFGDSDGNEHDFGIRLNPVDIRIGIQYFLN